MSYHGQIDATQRYAGAQAARANTIQCDAPQAPPTQPRLDRIADDLESLRCLAQEVRGMAEMVKEQLIGPTPPSTLSGVNEAKSEPNGKVERLERLLTSVRYVLLEARDSVAMLTSL